MTKGQGSLARALRALESSEGSERKIVADVIGSLKKPCKAGGPDMAIGTNGREPERQEK